jgi:hypothetical protein
MSTKSVHFLNNFWSLVTHQNRKERGKAGTAVFRKLISSKISYTGIL